MGWKSMLDCPDSLCCTSHLFRRNVCSAFQIKIKKCLLILFQVNLCDSQSSEYIIYANWLRRTVSCTTTAEWMKLCAFCLHGDAEKLPFSYMFQVILTLEIMPGITSLKVSWRQNSNRLLCIMFIYFFIAGIISIITVLHFKLELEHK